jgi:hypothetical protein
MLFTTKNDIAKNTRIIVTELLQVVSQTRSTCRHSPSKRTGT